MKKITLLSILALSTFTPVIAQNSLEPVLLEDTYLMKINPAGTLAAGQDGFGSITIGYDIITGVSEWYPACFPGDGNCISNNGFIVGQEMQVDGMYAAIMKDGEITVTDALKRGGMSQFNGITPDGSRACGYITNTSGRGALLVPFYCDITPEGKLLDPVLLPCPEKDLFGGKPQYVVGGCISDDGKVIVGLVTDGTGGYSWPIIFREDSDGKWSYTQPTESLFNPDNVILPDDPDETPNMLEEPFPEDYMTPEQIEDYHKFLAENPNYEEYWNFMTDEAYRQYYSDHVKWAEDVSNSYYEAFDEYHKALSQMGRDQHFGGILLISPDGSSMITAKSGTPYRFNLEDDTFAPLEIKTDGFTLTQILSDGTLVGCSIVSYSPYMAYLCPAGTSEFVKMTDYLAEFHPTDYEWLETTSLNSGTELITGVMLFSDDMQTICGGYNDGAGGALSYVFRSASQNGVENVALPEDGTLNVYNLQGVRVRGVENADDLRNLPKGIYIVNGRKIAI